MSKEYIPDMSDFQCIGYMIADAATKTASEKAGSPLEVMADFVTRMMLNK